MIFSSTLLNFCCHIGCHIHYSLQNIKRKTANIESISLLPKQQALFSFHPLLNFKISVGNIEFQSIGVSAIIKLSNQTGQSRRF
ncbi:hypothetical protein CBFG_01795 [Clostridiales bacterium 1_7_47FAA]|nr:hypothetical protein CBFG_01795 [Clostridiales bacterium 1_7_47FAA]